MKLKNGIVQSKVGGDYVAVATGEAGKVFNGMIRNNATAAFLVDKMMKETTVDELVKALLDTYDVSEEIARKDVENVVASFRKAGLLDE
ncbi:MAG: PqqD family protein [Lachnospiraceae bacterium]|nr:PqqD family protein [Lachnospira sp.]MBQ8731179.1 PqqD family protein [Lachnospiraceae bacterium]MBR6697507.1 PqqD family protein [Lachnospiraceae bacterium]